MLHSDNKILIHDVKDSLLGMGRKRRLLILTRTFTLYNFKKMYKSVSVVEQIWEASFAVTLSSVS